MPSLLKLSCLLLTWLRAPGQPALFDSDLFVHSWTSPLVWCIQTALFRASITCRTHHRLPLSAGCSVEVLCTWLCTCGLTFGSFCISALPTAEVKTKNTLACFLRLVDMTVIHAGHEHLETDRHHLGLLIHHLLDGRDLSSHNSPPHR